MRGFVLTGRRSQSTQQNLTILETHWHAIERHVDEDRDGPWMYAVTTSGLRPIEL